ncbi:hypothetical protein AB1Y20_017503 [Prymnesium parvum]|uniref:Inosine/uridine-preferring nucleoside hydrolase domain-containing protein n=1 Tax=Prymnesium parvum TaxID=97485 RepID=A0AB34JKQ6_PRYPA
MKPARSHQHRLHDDNGVFELEGLPRAASPRASRRKAKGYDETGLPGEPASVELQDSSADDEAQDLDGAVHDGSMLVFLNGVLQKPFESLCISRSFVAAGTFLLCFGLAFALLGVSRVAHAEPSPPTARAAAYTRAEMPPPLSVRPMQGPTLSPPPPPPSPSPSPSPSPLPRARSPPPPRPSPSPPPPPSSPPPPVREESWRLHPGRNCWWDGHGAMEVDSPKGTAVAGVHTVHACKEACAQEAHYRCEAILFEKEAAACFRKRHVDVRLCSNDNRFDLYVREDARPPSLATPLIIDTDLSFDVDDVMAVCVAHALHDLGEASLLAIVHDAGYPRGIGAVSVLSHFYAHDDVPLGAYKGEFGLDVEAPSRWKTGDYVPFLTEGLWPSPVRDSTDVPDAVATYRAALAAAEDRSVVIAAIGFATNLARLLRSAADDVSPLNGTELVRQKVRKVVWQGGWYPARHPGQYPRWDQEFNWGCGAKWYVPHEDCHGSAAFVVDNLPASVEQIFSEAGFFMPTGGPLLSCAKEDNPCREALVTNMEKWGLPAEEGRASWDALVVLAAVRGVHEVGAHVEGRGGFNWIDPNGTNIWNGGTDPERRQQYLVMEGDQHWKLMEDDLKRGIQPQAQLDVQYEVNRLLCRPPVALKARVGPG